MVRAKGERTLSPPANPAITRLRLANHRFFAECQKYQTIEGLPSTRVSRLS